MIILKFGGTSVSTPKSIETICAIVKKETARKPILVVSAVNKVTDTLLKVCDEKEMRQVSLEKLRKIHIDLVKSYFNNKKQNEIFLFIESSLQQIQQILSKMPNSEAKRDSIISFGEMLSSYIITQALIDGGTQAQQIIATDLIVTDNHFGSAEFLPIETQRKVKRKLLPLVNRDVVPVITGFIGATIKGETTTFGRGGSDYSAAIIGSCLNAEEIQFWKDIDGIYTADPRTVREAKLLEEISYQEAARLAMNGAKVLHPKTIIPLISVGIPIKVLNTFNPGGAGTYIHKGEELFL